MNRRRSSVRTPNHDQGDRQEHDDKYATPLLRPLRALRASLREEELRLAARSAAALPLLRRDDAAADREPVRVLSWEWNDRKFRQVRKHMCMLDMALFGPLLAGEREDDECSQADEPAPSPSLPRGAVDRRGGLALLQEFPSHRHMPPLHYNSDDDSKESSGQYLLPAGYDSMHQADLKDLQDDDTDWSESSYSMSFQCGQQDRKQRQDIVIERQDSGGRANKAEECYRASNLWLEHAKYDEGAQQEGRNSDFRCSSLLPEEIFLPQLQRESSQMSDVSALIDSTSFEWTAEQDADLACVMRSGYGLPEKKIPPPGADQTERSHERPVSLRHGRRGSISRVA